MSDLINFDPTPPSKPLAEILAELSARHPKLAPYLITPVQAPDHVRRKCENETIEAAIAKRARKAALRVVNSVKSALDSSSPV